MRLVCISDTHTFHEDVNLPDGDILIHAGDFTNKGGKSDVEDFFGWLMRIKPKYRYILFIAGNHDKCFDEKYSEMNDWLMSDWLAEAIAELEKNDIIYLKDSSIELEGVKFYGMPWTPWFFGEYWAFNKKIGPEMQEKIDMIEPCDVLITHGPPLYTGDLVAREGIHVGCPLLKEKIDEIQPRLHVCGHIHEASGIQLVDRCIHVNASQLNEHYELVNLPYSIELP